MSTITTQDGTRIYYKDWGSGQPILFSHGWPLNADAWESQMLFLASEGYRTIAHDRHGHGRSSQLSDGDDMDTYADDLVAAPERARAQGARRERRGSHDALPARVPPARHGRDALRRALHRRQADGLRLPRLPVHGHVDVDSFHVRGFKEQGTTTTPFGMVVMNGMNRYHQVAEALRRSARPREDRTPTLISECESMIVRATAYSREHLEDMLEIRDWTWTP